VILRAVTRVVGREPPFLRHAHPLETRLQVIGKLKSTDHDYTVVMVAEKRIGKGRIDPLAWIARVVEAVEVVTASDSRAILVILTPTMFSTMHLHVSYNLLPSKRNFLIPNLAILLYRKKKKLRILWHPSRFWAPKLLTQLATPLAKRGTLKIMASNLEINSEKHVWRR
jgi:hypothetical protein